MSCLWDNTDSLSFRSVNLQIQVEFSAVAIGVEYFAEVLNLLPDVIGEDSPEVIFRTDQVLNY